MACAACNGLRGSCFNGACRCDVCAGGCRYPTVQDAVADLSGPTTITICAGAYLEYITIDRDLNLIGAGEGSGAGDTSWWGRAAAARRDRQVRDAP